MVLKDKLLVIVGQLIACHKTTKLYFWENVFIGTNAVCHRENS